MINRIKVCFVGLGSIGRRHLKNLLTVASSRGVSVSVDALRHSNSALPDDIACMVERELFSPNEVRGYDWIFVCNPSQNHFETLLSLKESAKWFFVEKPLFVKPVGESILRSLGDPSNYYVACPLRYKKTYKLLKEYVLKHRVIGARAICSSYLPEWRPGVDYRLLYSATKESGGVKLDLIHEFDYLIDLFGFPDSSTLCEAKVSDLEIESSDSVSFIGCYSDKMIELHLDYFGRKSERSIEVWTPEETATFDFLDDEEDRNAPYMREMEYFFNVALDGAKNINDLAHANRVLDFIINSKGVLNA